MLRCIKISKNFANAEILTFKFSKLLTVSSFPKENSWQALPKVQNCSKIFANTPYIGTGLTNLSPLSLTVQNFLGNGSGEPFKQSICSRMISTSAPVNGNYDDPDKDLSLAWVRDGKVYDKGPDQILPSTAVRSWHRHGAVKLKIENHEFANRKPISIPTLLTQCASKCSTRLAMKVKRDNEWKKWTFDEYLQDVRTCAKGFITLGLKPYHSVCIIGFNAPEWFISNLGAVFAGGLSAGIYATNGSQSCAYIAKDSEANIFVVEDEMQLDKILSIRNQLPHLKAIVQYTGKPKPQEGVYSWDEMMKLGSQQPDTILEERLKNIAINRCCTLIYTSGTTGKPKGVMLSHDNLSWMAYVSQQCAESRDADDKFQEISVSFLPLSHIAAQMADLFLPLSCCGLVVFAQPSALKGTLVETMKEILPTKFFAVPRVWETMYGKIVEIGRNTKGIKKLIATWARSQALDCNMKRMQGTANPETLAFKIANKVVLSKIHDALGLSRCELALSGAAPLAPNIIKFFMSLNILVTEAYGMSETSGPHTMGVPKAFRLKSVGKTLTGCTTKIDNPDGYGNGEILMSGRHITMGYLHLAEKTIKAVDEDGWMHSEDIGRVDKDGFLFITGRLKEILITAGGENVAPIPIEDRIKKEIPAVSQAVLLGDKLKFISVLLTLKTEVCPDTQESLDKLLPITKDWLAEYAGISVNTIQDVLKELNEKKNDKLKKAFDEGMSRVNKRAISKAQQIKTWVILPKDFSMPGGEIGPTLKLKRKVVYEKYSDVIGQIYKKKQD